MTAGGDMQIYNYNQSGRDIYKGPFLMLVFVLYVFFNYKGFGFTKTTWSQNFVTHFFIKCLLPIVPVRQQNHIFINQVDQAIL